ncbi:MAG: hypothetical protein D3910_05735 [Candidatus Electrothrix sp. ATG2]|nr:hypothetical protein [Candidatus Electrothrix sp. ATG2]
MKYKKNTEPHLFFRRKKIPDQHFRTETTPQLYYRKSGVFYTFSLPLKKNDQKKTILFQNKQRHPSFFCSRSSSAG